ncbi:MAG TPA: thiamine phosphate synthase [Terriglobales bacterium]|nr:thiamine phosphate synthase [Terriglobales bacterium]
MRCLLYYITDRTEFPGEDDTQRRCLLEKIAEAVRCGVNFIQLREKDLPTRELEFLAREALRVARSQPETGNQKRETRILINSRTDIAIAVGADGVHLPAHDMAPQEARTIWSKCSAGALSPAIVSVSCHSEEDVRRAASAQADLSLFAPVFEKKDAPHMPPTGLEALRRAGQHRIPVLALGGVTLENARACRIAGAAGIAGIRLFQENDIQTVVQALRYA